MISMGGKLVMVQIEQIGERNSVEEFRGIFRFWTGVFHMVFLDY